jgi:hypothetical protein
MREDPLVRLLELAGVAPALARARAGVDRAYLAVRRRGDRTAGTGTGLRAAVASAELEGGRYDLEEVRAGTVTDPVLQGAVRCAEALPGLVARWPGAPRQVLARLHLLAARGVLDQDLLGRPAAGPAVAARLDALVELITGTAAPGLLRAAVVHGELLAIRAFPGPNGVVARAAARLELVTSGFDPSGLIGVDLGHRAREPEYVGSAGAFATGTPDGVRAWLRHCAAAVELAAAQTAGSTGPGRYDAFPGAA